MTAERTLRLAMRALWMVLSFVFVGLAFAACSGGSGFHCLSGDVHCHDPLTTSYTLRTPQFNTPATPIPVGTSVDVAFQEQKCTGNSSESGPPPGSGCSVWYTPATLYSRVLPMQGSAATPCPMTVAQIASGTLRFTRTGPGDPKLVTYPGPTTGYCEVQVYTSNMSYSNSGTFNFYI